MVQGLNSWRISFWITFALAGATALIGLFILPETYAPRILADKTKRLRKETGNEKLHTIFMREDEGWRARMARNLVRPFILIGTQLVIQLLASFFCIVYGTMYLLLTTWSSTFVDVYGESVGIASLNYRELRAGSASSVGSHRRQCLWPLGSRWAANSAGAPSTGYTTA